MKAIILVSLFLFTLFQSYALQESSIISAHESIESPLWRNPYRAVAIYKKQQIYSSDSTSLLSSVIALNNLSLAYVHTLEFNQATASLKKLGSLFKDFNSRTPQQLLMQGIYYRVALLELNLAQSKDTLAIKNLLDIKFINENYLNDKTKGNLIFNFYLNRFLNSISLSPLVKTNPYSFEDYSEIWPYNYLNGAFSNSTISLDILEDNKLNYLAAICQIQQVKNKKKITNQDVTQSIDLINSLSLKRETPLLTSDFYLNAIRKAIQDEDSQNAFLILKKGYSFGQSHNIKSLSGPLGRIAFDALGEKYPRETDEACPGWFNLYSGIGEPPNISFLLLSELLQYNDELYLSTRASKLTPGIITATNLLPFIVFLVVVLVIQLSFEIYLSRRLKQK